MIKKILIPVIAGVGFIVISDRALALEIDYKHKYEDISRQHTDEFIVSHNFSSGLGVSAKLKFHPEQQSNGDAGNFFDHRKLNEKEFKIKYTQPFTKQLSIEPGMVYGIKEEDKKYKPSIKLKYRISDNTRISFRYRKEITDRRNKPIKKTDRIDSEITQKVENFQFSYTMIWYNSNETLYNNKHQNIEHKIEAGYQLTKHLVPYIGVKNLAVSKKSADRQTEFITGISYKF
ncbi:MULTISPECIES: oligogalacturonate-specific porin KdgM family protein [unclassified Tatumella]|uniref:oligogalacturonate-specific porin KdgM family protein n=1 Tax=unclassified Tatumella TaxID=2649542 RepID=UPI001BB0C862|nr:MULTISPECIES: oligogalacturonate-specific porin KdgM family protein [unclassified Tatumella]MBS0878473.1 hypothetical protein [Tatumella sp. JGM82]MBS0891994.1 hypothetical protein [Tatumella sp. JGM94]MBS0903112.1 hypothetical protein [Tatumella sp. JGM100]